MAAFFALDSNLIGSLSTGVDEVNLPCAEFANNSEWWGRQEPYFLNILDDLKGLIVAWTLILTGTI